MKRRILTVVGARPNFMKVGPVPRALQPSSAGSALGSVTRANATTKR